MSSSKMEIENFTSALKAIKGGVIQKVIGFNTDYCIFVHEILTNVHPQGQAKFLETALRQGKDLLPRAIQRNCAAAKTPAEWQAATIKAVNDTGEQLIGNAQSLTPVKTGDLVASGTAKDPARVVIQ